MAKWPDTSVYTPIKNINKGNEYQEADGLTAADMNAIVENIDYLYNNSGGSGGSSGSIDADTLNGLLSAGNGISIGKTTAGEKVEIQIDKLNDFLLTPLSKVMGVGNATRYLGFTLTPDPKIKELTPVGVSYYTFEVGAPGNRSIICKDNLRTIFGNQSIVGSGNIDLYRHHILCSTPDEGIKVLITVISSKNLEVDSLTDLKTLLGNTFECPCIGYAAAQGLSLAICNENGFFPIDIWVNVVDPIPDVTWSNIESIVDTVTTI